MADLIQISAIFELKNAAGYNQFLFVRERADLHTAKKKAEHDAEVACMNETRGLGMMSERKTMIARVTVYRERGEKSVDDMFVSAVGCAGGKQSLLRRAAHCSSWTRPDRSTYRSQIAYVITERGVAINAAK
jgi:hypothetical protein